MNTTTFKKRQKTIGNSAVALRVIYLLLRRNQHRRWWVRPVNKRRKLQRDYHNLIQEMRLGDTENFFNYTRMSVDQFDLLLSWVGPVIKKRSYREPIGPGERLALTLRGQFISGEWHKEAPGNSALRPTSELNRRIGTRNATNNAIIYRNYIKQYANSEEGSVSWQLQAINT
ncbi:hypothetical protein RN001_003346 [Aquatica leii]|uniref:Uncharacterized protein n=1 Tax=Aquatica leii TaxID=1421715 RepID=A0AAN7QBM1_9COLE|nr:hypothetical protein RN001_003346 [Aquatica leii]